MVLMDQPEVMAQMLASGGQMISFITAQIVLDWEDER